MPDLLEQILAGIHAQAADRSSVSGRVTLPGALCAACAATLPVSGVGLALMDRQGPAGLVAATDAVVTLMEELQFSFGEGPCVEASRLGRPVLQPQLRATGPERWPGFGRAAVEAGIEAIFTFPLQASSIGVGALALYRDTPGMLSSDALGEALDFADAAVRIVLYLQDQMPLGSDLHPDLASVNSRAEVHQATGMIAVQACVGVPEALLLLRAHAYAEQRSILATAHDVVTRTLRFPSIATEEP